MYVLTLRNRCAHTIISIPFFCLIVVFFHSKTIRLPDIEDTLRLEALVGCDTFFRVCVCVYECVYVCVFSSVCARVHIGDKRTTLSVLLSFGPRDATKVIRVESSFWFKKQKQSQKKVKKGFI